MKSSMKKAIAVIAVAVLIASAAIGGTIAYFTDTTDTKENTFTVGKVDIDLVESGTPEEGSDMKPGTETATGLKYDNIVPGTTYAKKPVITVENNSLPAYVFADLLVSDYDELYANVKEAIKTGELDSKYNPDALDKIFLVGAEEGLARGTFMGKYMDGTTAHFIYSFGIKNPGDKITLFKGVTIPSTLNKTLEVIEKVDLNVQAFAIQHENINDETEALKSLGFTGLSK